jgi:hypothetical protein
VTEQQNEDPTSDEEDQPHNYAQFSSENMPLARDIHVPKNATEALNGEFAENWRQSMNSEFTSLIRNETWTHGTAARGRVPIKSKWMFSILPKEDGTVKRFKSRLVVQGFTQQPGFDFLDTCAPVAKMTSIRVLLALSEKHHLRLHQLDFETAYLNGHLEEEINMKLPSDLHMFIDESDLMHCQPNEVVRLLKGLYGLKQAGRVWNNNIHEFIVQIGFRQSAADRCICIYEAGSKRLFLRLYVDDCLIAYESEADVNKVIKAISRSYTIKDLGEPKVFLGISIDRNVNGDINIHQTRFARYAPQIQDGRM